MNKTIMESNENWSTIYSHNLADNTKMKWGDNFWKNLGIAVAVILILFATYQTVLKIGQK